MVSSVGICLLVKNGHNSQAHGLFPVLLVTVTYLMIPLDIAGATYLQPLPDFVLSTTNFICCRAVALQKRCEHLQDL
jgi:hypothetical protein